MTHSYVDVPGARLHVEAFGQGTPVLMPTGGGVPFYRNTFSPRFLASVQIVAVEMRGTGASTGSMDGQSFASMADDLEAVRSALGLERALVLGHSNHGCIALEFALRHPARASGILAVATAPNFGRAYPLGQELWAKRASPEARARTAQLQAAFEALDRSGMSADEQMLHGYLATAPLGWRDWAFDSTPLWEGAPKGMAHYFGWLFTFAPTYSLVPNLDQIQAPVLAISGRHDYACPVELWEETIEFLPDAELVVLEKSAHNPQFEQPDEFDTAALAFIERHT